MNTDLFGPYYPFVSTQDEDEEQRDRKEQLLQSQKAESGESAQNDG